MQQTLRSFDSGGTMLSTSAEVTEPVERSSPVQEIARGLVALCREGNCLGAIEKYYARTSTA